MFKKGLVDSLLHMLAESDFRAVDCRGSRSSFDVLAKRGEMLLLVKALANVEGFSRESASELKIVSVLLGGVPVVVGERMKSSDLADGVVYDRYGICVSNIKTVEGIINGRQPRAHSERGNYCVRVDVGLLSEARRRMGLTQESLARRLGVSKQSVYRYESSGSVSLEVFERLIDLFGEDFAQSEFKLTFEKPQLPSDSNIIGASLKRMVRQEFEDIGFNTAMTNAPFDIIASQREKVFSVVSNDWRRLQDKLSVLEEVSEILDGYTVCISERRVRSSVSVMSPDELSKIKSPSELFKLLSNQ
ncbi:MAG: helix-turn-helix domain-containing protein [Candidatus Altiarchaeota archaeon]